MCFRGRRRAREYVRNWFKLLNTRQNGYSGSVSVYFLNRFQARTFRELVQRVFDDFLAISLFADVVHGISSIVHYTCRSLNGWDLTNIEYWSCTSFRHFNRRHRRWRHLLLAAYQSVYRVLYVPTYPFRLRISGRLIFPNINN